MAYQFTDPKKASEAGRKSRRGRAKRAKDWEQLREVILNKHTEKFNDILNRLDGMDFIKAYLEVLKYFKPRLQSVEVKPDPKPPTPVQPYKYQELTQMSNDELINELKLLENGNDDKKGNDYT